MTRWIRVAIIFLPLLMLASCRHNTANMSNPQVALAVTLLDASNTCKTIEGGLTTANNVVERLQATEPDYYNHVKPLLKKISTANRTAQHTVDTVASGGTGNWKAAMMTVYSTVNPSTLTAFGFKNPTSQALVEGGLGGLVLALNQIPQKFGGTP